MGNVFKVAAANWRTTVAGIIAAVVAILNGVMQIVDGDAATNPDYALIIALVMTTIGLIRARDDVVSTSKMKSEGAIP